MPIKITKHLYILLVVFLFSNTFSYGQKTEPRKLFFGKVVNMYNGQPLESAHVINLSTTMGTISNYNGDFRIEAAVGDTIYLSEMGFHSKKIIVDKASLKTQNIIKLITQNYQLQEIILTPYDLTGILEVDVRNLIVESKRKAVKINGIKSIDEMTPNLHDKPTIFQPVDFIYNIFGKRPKQLKKLKKLEEQEQVRDLLYYKYDREFLMETLNLSRKQIEAILKYCNYKPEYIDNSNDLDILQAVLNCYEEYKKFYPEQDSEIKSDTIPTFK